MQITIDKAAVKASFSKAAPQYDFFADLQRDIGHQMMSLLCLPTTNINALDLGCGTGYFSCLLSDLERVSGLTCFDLSPEMLVQVKHKQRQHQLLDSCCLVQGDIDHLPFIGRQFDLIFSNLVLQWSEDLTLCLKQLESVLNPHGIVCFSTLLTGSLFELQQAWQNVDDNKHINQFMSEQQIKKALKAANFNNVKLTTETRVKRYPDLLSVMKALKGIGANHVHGSQQSSLSGKQLLEKLDQGYQPFIDKNGMYCLSYQVCYVIAESNS